MDSKSLALYPFVTEAFSYVETLGFSLERLLNSRALDSARFRGKERVIQSIEDGEIQKPGLSGSGEEKIVLELLSYPFSRILVSCINDSYLIRRYALAEAESASKLLKTENKDFLVEIANDFNVSITPFDSHFAMHFTDYIKLANTMKDLKWKLVNRRLKQGYVHITHEEVARLLQEAIRDRIQNALPLDVSSEACNNCNSYIDEIKEVLQNRKSDVNIDEMGEVDTESFPPCISNAISGVSTGANLGHSMRFALTSFLLNVGMSVDEIVDMFNVSPDFDEEKTRYQIEHIAGSSGSPYTPPSCQTMKTYGNCYGGDEFCQKINHPLNYYRKKLYKKAKKEKEKSQQHDS
ncbi:DNA primase, large subunit [Methanohalobium evestigatum Z-7303]|uniref:DNA primase large subunit PriL n=1 Tax=Methanohalobium evestigatum (strain ATCC BAA-1072 / DSM 3721 / NBRC 107634 / OCM 161 / Z-7303) TaxID=644295 RepID=D7E959_METEZ|nr:DNA primase regulatory subunit PriL [Methanohalobium evestigatum]ADI74007.1 DNA primase, large subunit [Methanohalobium evestigatum Z-7303]